MNFNCIFSSCNFKQNNIEEKEFLKHLQDVHELEIKEISKTENMSVKAVEMITISNSTVLLIPINNEREVIRRDKGTKMTPALLITMIGYLN